MQAEAIQLINSSNTSELLHRPYVQIGRLISSVPYITDLLPPTGIRAGQSIQKTKLSVDSLGSSLVSVLIFRCLHMAPQTSSPAGCGGAVRRERALGSSSSGAASQSPRALAVISADAGTAVCVKPPLSPSPILPHPPPSILLHPEHLSSGRGRSWRRREIWKRIFRRTYKLSKLNLALRHSRFTLFFRPFVRTLCACTSLDFIRGCLV